MGPKGLGGGISEDGSMVKLVLSHRSLTVLLVLALIFTSVYFVLPDGTRELTSAQTIPTSTVPTPPPPTSTPPPPPPPPDDEPTPTPTPPPTPTPTPLPTPTPIPFDVLKAKRDQRPISRLTLSQIFCIQFGVRC